MKIIEEEKTVKQLVTKYISDDGLEFQNRYECQHHESAIEKENQFKKLNSIKSFGENDFYPPFNGGENYENHKYIWYYVQTEEEQELINDYYNVELNCDFPEWVCIEICDDFEGYSSYLSNDINYVKELLDKLGYDITVTKRDNYNKTAI